MTQQSVPDSYIQITELYDQLHNELFKWACLMTQDDYLAQELVQEGFLRAINNWKTLKNLNFHQQRAWLYQTIKHLFIDFVRKKKNEIFLEDEKSLPIEGRSFDSYSESEWIELINSLPEIEGKVFVLRYVEEFTSSQIGKMLGIPPGTVRSKLSDARKHLRENLNRIGRYLNNEIYEDYDQL